MVSLHREYEQMYSIIGSMPPKFSLRKSKPEAKSNLKYCPKIDKCPLGPFFQRPGKEYASKISSTIALAARFQAIFYRGIYYRSNRKRSVYHAAYNKLHLKLVGCFVFSSSKLYYPSPFPRADESAPLLKSLEAFWFSYNM